ncbi:hypothetical protein LPJ62_000005 [Coemansia sp. RSA 2167]|nr:hypothetical protein LPJ58_000288 [Coemansia sp. RSA 1591]KAJ1779074.1 hypothetical protein LPJ54_001213 [Coemansia sp. RSA 1824]KAJ1793684.1 hypothetical protein LPJ62_000005 [Coemansia sp. RSA 2167]KAJ1795129.1 hypothetical protein LPJ67_000234 [Coemansia sp. RSA 1938]KAJ2154392.1 hypothetical protein J3F82_001245 [Coemansia sp. RSA 637]KAJ2536918.1 hypothetical protein IWW43_000459 [Coemansia sp. RSA 1935]
MAKTFKVVVLPGDGVGPEVTAEAVKVLKAITEVRARAGGACIEFSEQKFGGCAIDATGTPFPDATRVACESADAILLGAVGGPQWPRAVDANDASKGLGPRPEQGLLDLRKTLDLFANIRPMSFPAGTLTSCSPLKEELVRDAEFVVVRELVGGIYFGKRGEEDANGCAYDTMEYSVPEVERIARLAGALASQAQPKQTIHSIDKANVLATSRLWRRVVTDVITREFPGVKLEHHLVDSAAMLMVKNPRALNGVVLTENMFGDILSDEASVIPGSLGLLPSASLNGVPSAAQPSRGLYEPIHGSAPDIAGQGVANPVGTILSAAMMLRYSLGMEREAEVVELAVRRVLDSDELNGWEIRTRDLGGVASTADVGDAVVRAAVAYAEGLNVEDAGAVPALLAARPAERRGMTLCEKIIAHHAIGLAAPGDVQPGDMVCVGVDWTIASELTWKGMDKTYSAMGRPGVNRNDRFWLAIDHTADPRIMDQAKPRELVSTSEAFAEEASLVDFYRPNYTILHTEFYRERAQPGQLVIGADSHTCSAGAVGALSIGMGAADVVMPLVTGETWLQVPETVEIRFVGAPPFGIGGKDIILDVLRQLKRNTVAFERAVEYTGPGLKYMSCDARFACANMATEFGGIAGVFEADEITAAYVAKRKSPTYKKHSLYFRADADAQYAESHIIDLSQVDSLVALHPSPDNVVHVDEVQMDLDGCFIGACTTAEEDLILAALVLDAGLRAGRVPVAGGNRRVTPGSVPILAKLRRLGLVDVYERAGFTVGAPGCSYCLGIAADVAGDGEVWLSSQNRNFKNRMGPGSIANLASAATVAASSFAMKVANPRELLDLIDHDRYRKMLDVWMDKGIDVTVSEPNPALEATRGETIAARNTDAVESSASVSESEPADSASLISGKVQRFEENIDTDAIIPAQFMPGVSDEDLGTHAFQYFRPEFREKATQGFDIVVAGVGFGSGSSREEAPRALKGAGVKAVIAKSYAFIYSRNQPNMALLGIVLKDEKFYDLAQEGAEVSIDLPARKIYCGGSVFVFNLSTMEERLILGGGVTEMYKKYGNLLFRAAIAADPESVLKNAGSCGKPTSCGDTGTQELAW